MKLVKVVVEETTQTRHMVLVVEKVDLLEKVQIMVVVLNMVVVLVVLKVLRFVRQRVFHFH